MSQHPTEIDSHAALLDGSNPPFDGAALAEIVRLYGGMVYGTCLRITGDAHQAADATQ